MKTNNSNDEYHLYKSSLSIDYKDILKSSQYILV